MQPQSIPFPQGCNTFEGTKHDESHYQYASGSKNALNRAKKRRDRLTQEALSLQGAALEKKLLELSSEEKHINRLLAACQAQRRAKKKSKPVGSSSQLVDLPATDLSTDEPSSEAALGTRKHGRSTKDDHKTDQPAAKRARSVFGTWARGSRSAEFLSRFCRTSTIEFAAFASYRAPTYPAEFAPYNHHCNSRESIRKTLDQNYPQRVLSRTFTGGSFSITAPLPPGVPLYHPRALVVKPPVVIPPAQASHLASLYDQLALLKPKIKVDLKKKKQNETTGRSATPALHVGVWKKSSKLPTVTSESNQDKGGPKDRLIDEILVAIRNVLKAREPYIKAKDPAYWKYRTEIHSIWKSLPATKALLRKRPALDLGPLGFSLAMKRGGSEFRHVDSGDDWVSLVWNIAAGDFTGGELLLPQLDSSCSLQQGECLGFMARLLGHHTNTIKDPFGTPSPTSRVIFTVFTCGNLVKYLLRVAQRRAWNTSHRLDARSLARIDKIRAKVKVSTRLMY